MVEPGDVVKEQTLLFSGGLAEFRSAGWKSLITTGAGWTTRRPANGSIREGYKELSDRCFWSFWPMVCA